MVRSRLHRERRKGLPTLVFPLTPVRNIGARTQHPLLNTSKLNIQLRHTPSTPVKASSTAPFEGETGAANDALRITKRAVAGTLSASR